MRGGNGRGRVGERCGYAWPDGMAPERTLEAPAERGLDLAVQDPGDLEPIVRAVGLVADQTVQLGAERAPGGESRVGRIAEGEVEAHEARRRARHEQAEDEAFRLEPGAEVAWRGPRLTGAAPRDPAAVPRGPHRAPRRGARPVRDDDQPEAQGVRTILPNCLPSASRCCAADAVLERHHGVHDGPSRPAKSWPMTVANSALVDIVEPMIEICFQNTSRMSVSQMGPTCAPQVTSRPPLAERADRALPGGGAHVLQHHVHPAPARLLGDRP